MRFSPGSVVYAILLTFLAGLVVACGAKPPPAANPNPTATPNSTETKGPRTEQTDLKIVPLDVDAKGFLPCMMWTDNTGSAFFAVDGPQATLYRFSGPDYKTKQPTILDAKASWLSASAEGLVLTVSDKNEIRVLDPNTLAVTKTIAIPKLKRAVSAPSLSIAVAWTDFFKRELLVVDLKTGALTPFAPPGGQGNGYGNEVMMSPDGRTVYANDGGNITRWTLAGNTLTYGEKGPQMHGGSAYPITVSADSRFVAQPNPSGNPDAGKNYCTVILNANLQRQAILEINSHNRPLGFDVANNLIYTATSDLGLITFDLNTGVRKKDYKKFGKGDPRQFLVHPAGKKFVELQTDLGQAGSLTYVEVKN